MLWTWGGGLSLLRFANHAIPQNHETRGVRRFWWVFKGPRAPILASSSIVSHSAKSSIVSGADQKLSAPESLALGCLPMGLLGSLVIGSMGSPTNLKNISQIGNLPQIGVKIQNIWNHHLGYWWVIAPIYTWGMLGWNHPLILTFYFSFSWDIQARQPVERIFETWFGHQVYASQGSG